MHLLKQTLRFTGLCVCLATVCLIITSFQVSLGQSPSNSLPRGLPEAHGVDSRQVSEFIESANLEIDSLHSFMLVRHGKVVAECWWSPYDASTTHQLYSLSKSFTSMAVGLAIAEGKLSLDDQVAKLFPEDLPTEVNNNLKAMRVRDLLTMSTGHQAEPKFNDSDSWTKTFLNHSIPFKPGTHFLYNTPATYMCSAIVQRQTGYCVFDYLKPRLFDPLGFKNPTWGKSPQGITLGGYGLNVCTEDIAKFGQLLLNRGQWNGQQLIPAAWVDLATSKQTSNGSSPDSDWDQGYGFQFWRCRHGHYRGDGAFGQYCIVLPELDAVIAITSGVKNMQAVLNLIWDKLIPGMSKEALPENSDANNSLVRLLGSLQLPTVPGIATSGFTAAIGKTIKFDNNSDKIESISVVASDSGKQALQFNIAGEMTTVPVGQIGWHRLKSRWGSNQEQQLATSAAWTSDNQCKLKVCFVETPFVQTSQLTFEIGQVTLETEFNVAFGSTNKTKLVGKVE